MLPKPPFAWQLSVEEERAQFHLLQPRLADVWQTLTTADEAAHTSVVVPGLNLDGSELQANETARRSTRNACCSC